MDATQTESRWKRFISVVRAELEPYPGRGNLMVRLLLTSTITIIISQSLQIPMLSLSLIGILFVTQSNTVLTQIVALIGFFSGLFAIGMGLLLLKYTFDYPLLRIMGASILVFFSIYMMRVCKFGIFFYLLALAAIYMQSFVDLTDQPELLLRLILWCWIAGTYPMFIALVINSLFLPTDPQKQLYDAVCRQLNEIQAQLDARIDSTLPKSTIEPKDVEQNVLTLHKLLLFATLKDKALKQHKVHALAYISIIDRLYTAAAKLSHMPAVSPNIDELKTMSAIRSSCESLKETIYQGPPFTLPLLEDEKPLNGVFSIILLEMKSALRQGLLVSRLPETEEYSSQEPLFVPDIKTNPVYVRFALKTLLATLLGYLFYNAVQWDGIHTIMLTSIIIALPSLGAASHKSILRVTGCLIGSAIALLSVIFVMPYIESIVGLLLLCLPVFALGAWITAGSERSNYIGIQIIFCFSLALLDAFGPTTSVTEIRDRLIGILLGVAITTVIYIFIWPEREGSSLRKNLTQILVVISSLLTAGDKAPSAIERRNLVEKARLQAWSLMGKSETMLANISLEPSWRYRDHEMMTLTAQTLLAKMREVLLLANDLQIIREHNEDHFNDVVNETLNVFSQSIASTLECLGAVLEDEQTDVFSLTTHLPLLRTQAKSAINTIQNMVDSDPNQLPLFDNLFKTMLALNTQVSQILELIPFDHKPENTIDSSKVYSSGSLL